VTDSLDALVGQAQSGDRAALDRLLRDQQPMIHAVCRRITGNDVDALDATQEALIAVVRGLHRFDGRAKFSTWVYRIATNASLDELRRRRRRPVATLDADDGREPGTAGDVAAQVVARLDTDAALATLSPEYRAAVVLRDLCALDYAEIADVLDIPPGTVRSRIARGRAAIADHLAGNQSDPERRPTV
jgi:RNA polymerase sigma-70 factor (ECF subfamily)